MIVKVARTLRLTGIGDDEDRYFERMAFAVAEGAKPLMAAIVTLARSIR